MIVCSVAAQDEKKAILETMMKFSATTAPNGAGADAYGTFLAEDFSRWTLGSDNVSKKKDLIESVRDWFDDGWPVSDRHMESVHIDLRDDLAFVRRIVSETYTGPDGESSASRAALAEIWVKKEQSWLLLRVDLTPLNN